MKLTSEPTPTLHCGAGIDRWLDNISLRKQNYFVVKAQMTLFGSRLKNTLACSASASELSKSLMTNAWWLFLSFSSLNHRRSLEHRILRTFCTAWFFRCSIHAWQSGSTYKINVSHTDLPAYLEQKAKSCCLSWWVHSLSSVACRRYTRSMLPFPNRRWTGYGVLCVQLIYFSMAPLGLSYHCCLASKSHFR